MVSNFNLNVDFSGLHRCVEQMGAAELEEPFSIRGREKEKEGWNGEVKYLYTMHPVDDEHLACVMREMEALGAPAIRVVDMGDGAVMAIEGTHRIEAARRLGLIPELIVLDQNDLVEADSLDLDILAPGEKYTAGEIAGEVYSMHVGIYVFDEDGHLCLEREAKIVP